MDSVERLQQYRVGLHRGLPRPAGQQKERVGRRFALDGRDDSDIERDLAAVWVGAIFRHVERGAFGADLLPTGHWQHAIRQDEGGLLRHAGRGGLRGAGRQQQADEQDEQKGLAHGLLHGWGSRVPAKSDIQ